MKTHSRPFGRPLGRLRDCQALARQHPTTFHIPRESDIAALAPGDAVKLIFGLTPKELAAHHPCDGERMWVLIESRDGDTFRGELRNEPAIISALALGDRITFLACHVASIE